MSAYGDEERRTLGWSRHLSAVEVQPVPGMHVTLGSEPHVRVLAGHVRQGLARARRRTADVVDATSILAAAAPGDAPAPAPLAAVS
jgi:hypothetical protein